MNGSEELQAMAWAAEDAGSSVYVWFVPDADGVIERIEVDGVEFVNEVLDVELDSWVAVAESYWRQ